MSNFAYPLRILLRVVGHGCGLVALMLAFMPAARATFCAGAMQPLQFGDNVMNLPEGSVGQPYKYLLHATGGTPPYVFHAKSLPPGLALSPNGVLAGDPGNLPLIAVFQVSAQDVNGCVVEKRLRVKIMPPAQSAQSAQPAQPAQAAASRPSLPPPAEPPPPEQLSAVSHADVLGKPASVQPEMDAYMLTSAVFDDKDVLAELKQMSASDAPAASATSADASDNLDPDPAFADDAVEADSATGDDEAKAVDDAVDVDAKAQFERLLQPLIGVEYPGRDLFAAALDTRLCRFSTALIVAAARKKGLALPHMGPGDCPPDWSTSTSQASFTTAAAVAWKDVPRALMSSGLRDVLIDKARQAHPLLDPVVPSWDGTGCGCVLDLSGEIYGFYPFWRTGSKPQPLDFSLLSRISLFALWYRDNGDLVVPNWTTPQQTAFIREAHRHRTQLDYTLYHNDWQFLEKAAGDGVARIASRLAEQAADLIDTPLPGLVARSHAWVPGFSTVERMGDGLTFFPDQVPAAGSALREPYERYVDLQIRALVIELRHRQRPYVLNIVLRDTDLEAKNGVWQVERMYDYVREAEAPNMQDDHIVVGGARYRSNTNVTLHYLVLLTDPTVRSKRDLRMAIYQDQSLNEDDRRVLLRKLIPVVSSGDASTGEIADQMAYFADNFGGVGFWATPDRNEPTGRMISERIRASFLTSIPEAERFDAWVCTHRWPLRMAFEALLLLWLIAFLVYRTNCRFRKLPYQLGLLIGAVGIVVLGALLLAGDPSLDRLREGNSLLLIVLVALIVSIAYHILKPRVEKP
jgi:hypothetical protein